MSVVSCARRLRHMIHIQSYLQIRFRRNLLSIALTEKVP